jgi:hypothetical protein
MTGARWRYLNTGKKKHMVRDADLVETLMEAAICGTQVMAALPPYAKWHSDETGLAGREPCKQCATLLEKETHV